MARRACCVDNPDGLGFSIGGQCYQCIGKLSSLVFAIMIMPYFLSVFGWFIENLHGVERSDPYSIAVGYQKRPDDIRVSLAFNIEVLDQGSAGKLL